jgi:TonB family protein
MSEAWKQYEGQVVDHSFPLQQFLASTEHSAVFLTQHGQPQPQKAAIKLIPADPATSDLQLSRWRMAAELSHPHLLRLLRFGRCQLGRMNFLYAVTEFAEEDLSQILPQRPLTAAEAREMLEPLLDALVYLHEKGLVHGHLKPSNILAAGDQLKLSGDTLSSIAESRPHMTRPSPYDAPEVANSGVSPAADIWSLGMTLVEALTQRVPDLSSANPVDSVPQGALPQPFLDIAQHTLLRDPKRRWSAGEIAARLNPAAVAAAAAGHSFSPAAVSPLAVPLSTVSAVPAAKLSPQKFEAPAPSAQPVRPQPTSAAKQTLVLPNYVVPALAAVFIVVAIVVLPKILSRRPDSSSSTTSASAPSATPSKPAEQPAHRQASPPAPPAAKSSVKTADKKPAAEPSLPPATAPVTQPAPATLRTDTFPSANAPSSSAVSPARGEVLDQVLPDVSEKARATIRGTVRVAVRVHVDAAGNVSQADLDSPGPSQYFADLAMKAARRWEFTSPEVDGRSVPSEWLIRFEFSQSGTKTFPKQTTP